MIGKLSGILDRSDADRLIVDVGGVGYVVQVSSRTAARLGGQGDPVSLYVDTHVREDAISLYGFVDTLEQHWFRLLYSVQGVGPKAAMAILSVCPPEQLGFIITSGDKGSITRADGVGPKLAVRILTELKDKAGKMDLSPRPVDKLADQPVNNKGAFQDAVSALTNLGYAKVDAFQAVLSVQEKANDNLSEMIKLALKELSA